MFIRDAWYVAALSREISAKPLARLILGEPLVLYRTDDGEAVILSDRCPHRGARLSQGLVRGGALVCGYHGFAFDRQGHCTAIPGQDKVPGHAHVRHYPTMEKWDWVFVWMGDAARAAAAPLPDYHWLDDPAWVGRDELLAVRAGYGLVRDNLLDLSHAQFVHQKTLATTAVTQTPIEAVIDDGIVRVTRDMRDIEPSPFFRRLRGFAGRVDHHQTIEFIPPCHVVIKVRVSSVAGSGEDKVAGMRVLNALTPETDGSTLYFWGLARDFALDDDAATELAHTLNRDTFFEDVAVLEGQQDLLRIMPDRPEPVLTRADLGCVLADRLMAMLAPTQGGA